MDSTLKLWDDSGFVGLVDASRFNAYVDEDWELDALFERYTEECNKGTGVVWATGIENPVQLHFVEQVSKQKAFREESIALELSEGKLHLVNFEDLSMAAQFDDFPLPSEENKDKFIALNKGVYRLQIRQLFDPKQEEQDPIFEIVVQPMENFTTNQTEEVLWLDI